MTNNGSSLLPNEIALQNGGAQNVNNLGSQALSTGNNRREYLANNAALHQEIVGGPLTHLGHHITQGSGAHTANSGKRKHKNGGINSHVTKSMKDSGGLHVQEGAGSSNRHHNDRNAHTSIDWKIAKKKGLGLSIHNQSNSVHP